MQTLKNNNNNNTSSIGGTFSSDQSMLAASDKISFNNSSSIGHSSSDFKTITTAKSISSSSSMIANKKNLTPLATPLTSNHSSIHQERKHHHNRKDHHHYLNVNNSTTSIYCTPNSNNTISNNNGFNNLNKNTLNEKTPSSRSNQNNNMTIMVTPSPQKPQQPSHPTKPPLVESHRYSRQAQTLHSSAQYDKAARCSRKALSVLERAKNYTCDSNALEAIDWMASHYRSNYRYQKNMFEAVTAPYGSTISNGGSNVNAFGNNSQRRSQPRKNNVVVTEKYGDRQVIMPNEEDLGESMIGDLVMTPFNNTPTPTTACTSLYSELYAMFIHPWLQYQKVLEECSENAQLKGLFSKTIMTTQQRLYQLMQKTQCLEESESMNASSAVSPVQNTTSIAMNTDLSKKLLSLTYSLNADKATRLSQQILKKDKEVELLKRKIKEQQDIISQHEENWRLMKLEAEKTFGTSQDK